MTRFTRSCAFAFLLGALVSAQAETSCKEITAEAHIVSIQKEIQQSISLPTIETTCEAVSGAAPTCQIKKISTQTFDIPIYHVTVEFKGRRATVDLDEAPTGKILTVSAEVCSSPMPKKSKPRSGIVA